jgi:hypothetical protein
MTAATETALRQDGDRPCPPWCTDHHPDADIHRTPPTTIEFDKPGHFAYCEAVGYENGYGPPRVSFYARHHDVGAGVVREVYQGVSPDDARKLADLIEILSRATPAQHRKIAAAIRQAAADITRGE